MIEINPAAKKIGEWDGQPTLLAADIWPAVTAGNYVGVFQHGEFIEPFCPQKDPTIAKLEKYINEGTTFRISSKHQVVWYMPVLYWNVDKTMRCVRIISGTHISKIHEWSDHLGDRLIKAHASKAFKMIIEKDFLV